MKKKFILLMLLVLISSLHTKLFAQNTNKNLPFAKIEGAKNGVISKDALLKLDSLTISDSQYIINLFTMSKSVKGGDIRADNSTSNLLTKAMKQMLSQAEIGDKIWIENIQAIGIDGKVIQLEYISLKVE